MQVVVLIIRVVEVASERPRASPRGIIHSSLPPSSLISLTLVVGLEFLSVSSSNSSSPRSSLASRTSSSQIDTTIQGQLLHPLPAGVFLFMSQCPQKRLSLTRICSVVASSAQPTNTRSSIVKRRCQTCRRAVFARASAVVSLSSKSTSLCSPSLAGGRLALLFYTSLFPIQCRNPHHYSLSHPLSLFLSLAI